MSTHNIHFHDKNIKINKKISRTFAFLSYRNNSLGTQRMSSNQSPGHRCSSHCSFTVLV